METLANPSDTEIRDTQRIPATTEVTNPLFNVVASDIPCGTSPVSLQTPPASGQISLLQGKRAALNAAPRAPYTLENVTFLLTVQTYSDTAEQGRSALGKKGENPA